MRPTYRRSFGGRDSEDLKETGEGAALYGVLKDVTAQDLRFKREWVYIAFSILAWMAFWDMAEQNQHDFYAQMLGWTAVILAVTAAYHL